MLPAVLDSRTNKANSTAGDEDLPGPGIILMQPEPYGGGTVRV